MGSFPAPVTPAPAHARSDQFHFQVNQKKLSAIDLDDTLDADATDGNGHVLFGSGNPADHWATREDGGFELGLNVHYRQGNQVAATIDNDGLLHYTLAAGAQVIDPAHGVFTANANRGAMSFDWDIDSNNMTLEQFLAGGGNIFYELDFDPTAGVDYHQFRAVFAPSAVPGGSPLIWVDAAGNAPIQDDGGNAYVSQNSQNLAFYPPIPGDGVSPAGDYNVRISVVGANGNVAINSIEAVIHLI